MEKHNPQQWSKWICSIWRRLKRNDDFRRRFLLTCAVCSSYVVLGCVVVQIGTALPDLQTLVGVDLGTVSWLFTAWSIGYIVGSLVSGIIYDRLNRLSCMGIYTIGCAIFATALPWSPSFLVMVVVRVATGLFCGAVDTGANTIVPSIWGHRAGPFMQALYLSYTIGGIVCPLTTRPFMTADIDDATSAIVDGNSTLTYNLTIIGDEFLPNYNLKGIHNRTSDTIADPWSLQIHFAFILIGAATFLTSIPYFVMAWSGDYDVRANDDSEATSGQHRTKVSKCRVCGIIIFVCIVNLLYAATEDCIGAFLVTFSLEQLEWSKTQSVILLALYWGTSCLGGVIGVFIVRRLGLARMTFAACSVWIVAFLGALLCAQFGFQPMIWIFIPLSGMCMVVIIPNVISWTEAYVCNVSGKVSSFIMMSTGTGIAANPPFIGHLMEKYSIMCFLYVLFIESVLCTLSFASAYAVLRCFNPDLIVHECVEIHLEEREKNLNDDISVRNGGADTVTSQLLNPSEMNLQHT